MGAEIRSRSEDIEKVHRDLEINLGAEIRSRSVERVIFTNIFETLGNGALKRLIRGGIEDVERKVDDRSMAELKAAGFQTNHGDLLNMFRQYDVIRLMSLDMVVRLNGVGFRMV